MMIVFQSTAAVVGRAPNDADVRFAFQVVHLAREFDKAGRPLSGSEK